VSIGNGTTDTMSTNYTSQQNDPSDCSRSAFQATRSRASAELER
jgi:hypothetical protein